MTAVVAALVVAVCVLGALLPWAVRRRGRPGDGEGGRGPGGRGARGRDGGVRGAGGRGVRARAPGTDGAHGVRAPASPGRTGVRRRTGRARPREAGVDAALLLDLCAAGVRGGVAVPHALVVTGRHLGGPDGDALVRVGTALGLGTPWEVAWAGTTPAVTALGEALRGGWGAGASPAVQLRAAAARHRRERRARARASGAALGVRLTLPLGLCFLPAFVLLGLVPVVLGIAGDLLGARP